MKKDFKTLEDLKVYLMSYRFKPSDKCKIELLLKNKESLYKLNCSGYRIPNTAFYLHHQVESTGDDPGQIRFLALWTISNQLGLKMRRDSYRSRKAAIVALFELVSERSELFSFEDGQLLLSEQAFNISEKRYNSCKLCIDPIKEEKEKPKSVKIDRLDTPADLKLLLEHTTLRKKELFRVALRFNKDSEHLYRYVEIEAYPIPHSDFYVHKSIRLMDGEEYYSFKNYWTVSCRQGVNCLICSHKTKKQALSQFMEEVENDSTSKEWYQFTGGRLTLSPEIKEKIDADLERYWSTAKIIKKFKEV